MSKKQPDRHTVSDICSVMESIAPPALAQDWDNVGLLAGDPAAGVRRVLLCIDLTPPVVEEAIAEKVQFVMAYHPPIFKPVASLRADSTGTDAAVFRCIERGIALYSTHTALDAADGGTNDVIAEICGIKQTEPLEYVDQPGPMKYKLVVFVPSKEVEHVANAMFAAGAGHIGDYAHCSYRSSGHGTFLGGDSTNPTAGERGRFEQVEEIRLETVVPGTALSKVVTSLIAAHSYDEPAYDIYPIQPTPVRGIGRHGQLPEGSTLGELARKLKRATSASTAQIVGPADRKIERAVIVVGAAGSLPFRMKLSASDVIITGEIRHHEALTIQRLGCTAIALNHWTSERPVLPTLGNRMEELLPGVTALVSKSDREPFQPV
ncbi:MAG: Nif3-like dinuclear metal center hexameric protein [Planctomycetes bacterium]|nr:Nif3-like dinuclear metal center hexameric protein [Planctomycetota bacterium]